LSVDRKFKGYVGSADFHDGTIHSVQRDADGVRVEVTGFSGKQHVVKFFGVTSMVSRCPEGMLVYALAELETDNASSCYVFVNESESEGARELSVLEISAEGFTVEEPSNGN
jgi:hypothetical protein